MASAVSMESISIKLLLVHDELSDVLTVVSDTFQVAQNIQIDRSRVPCAQILVQPLDMTLAEPNFHLVNCRS